MFLARRRWRRQADREDRQLTSGAREAVAHIVCCFTSDPDEYEVRGAVVFHPPEKDAPTDAPPLMVAEMLWLDDDRDDYFMSADPWRVVREIVPARDVAEGRETAIAWIGPTCRELAFESFPGLYQHVFVTLFTAGREPPLSGTEYLWFLPPESDDAEVRMVRAFPSGIGETGPPIGEVGVVLMERVAVAELLRQRGW